LSEHYNSLLRAIHRTNLVRGTRRISSSRQTKLPRRQEAIFRDALCALNTAHVPYVVTGAFALALHTGIWHPTKDLDIALTHSSTAGALATLRQAGFQTEVLDPVWLGKAYREDFFVDLIFGMSNGVLVVRDSWIERSYPGQVADVDTRILAPEELLVSKLFVARRDRYDGADVVHLLYKLGEQLDWLYVLDLLGEHWQLLLLALTLFAYVYPANTDIIPRAVWTNLTGRLQQTVLEPKPPRVFRGTLIDPDLFKIDVSEWGFEDQLEMFRFSRGGENPRSPVPSGTEP